MLQPPSRHRARSVFQPKNVGIGLAVMVFFILMLQRCAGPPDAALTDDRFSRAGREQHVQTSKAMDTSTGAGLRIYFAGSIRGGRDDLPLYQALIAHLQQRHSARVLTEHIGRASIEAMGETGRTESYIYERDMAWLLSSDAVIAEVTQPSLGVGYELAKAETMGIPVLCIFRSGDGVAGGGEASEASDAGGGSHGKRRKSLSAMIRGAPQTALFRVADYSDAEQGKRLIDEFMATLSAK